MSYGIGMVGMEKEWDKERVEVNKHPRGRGKFG